MSSGGMDWAYRMIAKHKLDPLRLAVVMHLGWRDVAPLRTDRGIARALGQHRSSVAKATAKLVAMGIIERRSGLWVAVETIRIVEESGAKNAPVGVDHSVGHQAKKQGDHSVGRGGPLSGPQKDHPVGHKRKEKYEKGSKQGFVAVSRSAFPDDRRQRSAKIGSADIAAAHAALSHPATSESEKAQIWDWLAKAQSSQEGSAHAERS